MPKFKFSNSAESTEEVKVLPCRHDANHEFETKDSSAAINYTFDNHSSYFIELSIDDQWFSNADLDELIAFLKAAKKRGVKIQAKREL